MRLRTASSSSRSSSRRGANAAARPSGRADPHRRRGRGRRRRRGRSPADARGRRGRRPGRDLALARRDGGLGDVPPRGEVASDTQWDGVPIKDWATGLSTRCGMIPLGMKRGGNPFQYCTVALGDAFADRETELWELCPDIENGQNVVVFAPRRYGKAPPLSSGLVRRSWHGERSSPTVDVMTAPTKEKLAEKLARAIHDDIASAFYWVRARRRSRSSAGFGSPRRSRSTRTRERSASDSTRAPARRTWTRRSNDCCEPPGQLADRSSATGCARPR